jgi:hypothetical protein
METGIERLLAMTYPLRHCEPEAKLSRCYDRDCRVAVAPRNDRMGRLLAMTENGTFLALALIENGGSAQ